MSESRCLRIDGTCTECMGTLWSPHYDPLMSPKRACDTCISRKVKCNGSWPCDTCHGAVKRTQCTYLKPARRRGPKSRRTTSQANTDKPQGENEHFDREVGPVVVDGRIAMADLSSEDSSIRPIPIAVLETVVRLYQRHSYSVWPVIDADALLSKLKNLDTDSDDHHAQNTVCLITALCAATMAQLHIGPQVTETGTVDSTTMVQICLRTRNKCDNHGEHMDLRSIMVSFFLHVYHAKVNQRHSAMMYIQEAIAGARVLRLDEGASQKQDELVSNKALVFPLLWVSERGYALHLGLSPSYNEPLSSTELEGHNGADVEGQGLLELAKLFVAFDRISVRRRSSAGATAVNLTDTERELSSLSSLVVDSVSARTADYHITRQWMRTILWQQALSTGLLSSSAYDSVLTFSFPAQVSRDLLHALRWFRETDLLPLGRDQVREFTLTKKIANLY
ncbi:unnamed protein product [Penicillium olsonii]|nr:unnamed protein product [Penicillium olsonii]